MHYVVLLQRSVRVPQVRVWLLRFLWGRCRGRGVIVDCDCWLWLLTVIADCDVFFLWSAFDSTGFSEGRRPESDCFILFLGCHCFCILSNVLFVYCRERSEQLIGKGCVVLDCRIIRCWIIEIGGLVKIGRCGGLLFSFFVGRSSTEAGL